MKASYLTWLRNACLLRKSWQSLCLMGIALAGLPGCDTKAPGIKVGGAPAAQPDSVEAIKQLDAAQADLKRGPAGGIVQVTFRQSPLTDALAATLVDLPSLQNLVVGSSDLTMEGWQNIGKLTKLRVLDVRDCKLNDAQFKAAISGLSQLVVLKLSGKSGATAVTDAGIGALANCPNLRGLAADYCEISVDGLSKLTNLKSLSELYLAGSLVDDDALTRIAEFPNLTVLRVAKTVVSQPGLEKLTQLPLEELDLSECSLINDAALEPVGKIKSLKKLNLWRDAVGDNGIAHLKDLVNLEWLNVDNTQLSDAGLPAFAGFTKLTFLHLGSTQVTDAGMPSLVPLKSLKDLKVSRTGVTEAGAESLRKLMPGLDIQLAYGRDAEQ